MKTSEPVAAAIRGVPVTERATEPRSHRARRCRQDRGEEEADKLARFRIRGLDEALGDQAGNEGGNCQPKMNPPEGGQDGESAAAAGKYRQSDRDEQDEQEEGEGRRASRR